ncbi:DUF3842 family protein [Geosporobacter ferrireducens]|uniref:DUF3842 domain-containing protein n=1 Tax=Geosporobacter ferrireducens TaxID=1424294 RepID=A0A1D8GE68_9FIRM|nr:DUF3842 family protein [Geosporobacter ferrireducens]AOT69204.1 hypothetical protein Gferi_06280 [Geosporobacter ferrireducens]MTI56883.1 DUF3842 family protein [Geosporobacter ferrireducens]
MIIAVIDGMGGGIGSQIVTHLRQELPPHFEIYGLGTNATATSAMLKNHANKGATGENAIMVSIKKASVILGPASLVIPNAMMGEVTPRIATAIADAEALKILLPILPDNFELVGLENKPLMLLIKDAIGILKKEFNIK